MTAQETLRYMQSRQGLCTARDYLSAALHLDARIAVKQTRADTLRARRSLLCAGETQQALDALEQEIQADYASLFRRQRQIDAVIRSVPEDMSRLVLECRDSNPHAISFYMRNGYTRCENYPPYEEEDDAVCLEKELV